MSVVNARAKKLRAEVLELPRETRAELAHDLLLSLEDGALEAPADVEKAWAEELDRRILDVKEGRVKLVPAEEAFRQLRAGLKRARPQRAR
jgi:putative addiction module component (TIGR02574 family)